MIRPGEDPRQAWLRERRKGIGASDAAAIVGRSPYRTNVDLWEEKTGRRVAPDISARPQVAYGTQAEAYLRGMFALDYPQYTVHYDQYRIFSAPEHPFIRATLDGWLEGPEGTGVLEIKTAQLSGAVQWAQWDGRIPDAYYVQALHQLLATGFDFALLKAQLRQERDGEIRCDTRHYRIIRAEVREDLAALLAEEVRFWGYVEADRRPPLRLPEIG